MQGEIVSKLEDKGCKKVINELQKVINELLKTSLV